MISTDPSSLNNTNLMRAYGRHMCWFLHMVIKYFPEDSERRDDVLRKFSEIAADYRLNMLDTERLSRNLRDNMLQGSTLNHDYWLKMLEDRAD